MEKASCGYGSPAVEPRRGSDKSGSGSDFITVTVDMLAVERERAKSRQGERTDLEEPSGNVSKKSPEEPARDKAAEKVNADVSGGLRTWE